MEEDVEKCCMTGAMLMMGGLKELDDDNDDIIMIGEGCGGGIGIFFISYYKVTSVLIYIVLSLFTFLSFVISDY